MPVTTSTAGPDHPKTRAIGTSELKWLSFLAAMLVAIVVDGMAVSDMNKAAPGATVTSEQASITMPADRCGAGCSIMMASNQSPDSLR